MARFKELFSTGSGIVHALLIVAGLLSGITQAGAVSDHEQSKNPTTSVNSDGELLDLAQIYWVDAKVITQKQ